MIPQISHDIYNPSWEDWFRTFECEKVFPMELKPFQKVITVQCLRPDRAMVMLVSFLQSSLKVHSVFGKTKSLQELFEKQSAPHTPILFITTLGSDPSEELESFSRLYPQSAFESLSLGGNQNDMAMAMLKRAMERGSWLYLKNIHLVISFLPQLEKELKTASPHQNFRLWLTTEAHPLFPAVLLKTCFNVAYQTPPGVKKSAELIFKGWHPDEFDNKS